MAIAVAIDSSNNGKYYGIILSEEHVLHRVASRLLKNIPNLHMRNDKRIERRIALNEFQELLRRYSGKVKLLCIKVGKSILEEKLLYELPRTPNRIRAKLLQASIAITLLDILLKEISNNTSLKIYVDSNERYLFRELQNIRHVTVVVDKNLVVPADIIAWLNNRGEDIILKHYIKTYDIEQHVRKNLEKRIRKYKKRRKHKQ